MITLSLPKLKSSVILNIHNIPRPHKMTMPPPPPENWHPYCPPRLPPHPTPECFNLTRESLWRTYNSKFDTLQAYLYVTKRPGQSDYFTVKPRRFLCSCNRHDGKLQKGQITGRFKSEISDHVPTLNGRFSQSNLQYDIVFHVIVLSNTFARVVALPACKSGPALYI